MDIRIEPDRTGFAPKWARWFAVDDATYDGADDSRTRNQIGFGETPEAAVANLMEKLNA